MIAAFVVGTLVVAVVASVISGVIVWKLHKQGEALNEPLLGWGIMGGCISAYLFLFEALCLLDPSRNTAVVVWRLCVAFCCAVPSGPLLFWIMHQVEARKNPEFVRHVREMQIKSWASARVQIERIIEKVIP